VIELIKKNLHACSLTLDKMIKRLLKFDSIPNYNTIIKITYNHATIFMRQNTPFTQLHPYLQHDHAILSSHNYLHATIQLLWNLRCALLSNSTYLGGQLTWIHRPVDLLKFTKKCTIHYRHLQVSFNIKLTYIQLVIRNGYIAYHTPKFKTNDINWCWYNSKQDKLTTFKDSFIFLCTRTIFKNE